MKENDTYLPTLTFNESVGANNTSEAYIDDTLFIWSWFIVGSLAVVGLISNIIVIHAVCFVKRFRRSVH